MKSGKFLLSILASVAAGATIAMLFYPDKDSSKESKEFKKNREQIDELGAKFNKFMVNVSQKFETLKTQNSFHNHDGKVKA